MQWAATHNAYALSHPHPGVAESGSCGLKQGYKIRSKRDGNIGWACESVCVCMCVVLAASVLPRADTTVPGAPLLTHWTVPSQQCFSPSNLLSAPLPCLQPSPARHVFLYSPHSSSSQNPSLSIMSTLFVTCIVGINLFCELGSWKAALIFTVHKKLWKNRTWWVVVEPRNGRHDQVLWEQQKITKYQCWRRGKTLMRQIINLTLIS